MRRVSLALCALVFLVACGGGGSSGGTSAQPKHGGTVTLALENELRTLDPIDSSLFVEREVFYNMYDSLFTTDTKLSIKEGLVTKWDTSDPKNYAFTLRSDVKFHDGSSFDATVVKWNLERYKTGANSRRKSDLASVDTIEVKTANQVILHLKKADATLLAQLVDRAGMMLSPAAVQKGGADFSRNPLGAGSGPFAFVEWKRNDHLTLKKNSAYWKAGLPYLDGVTYKAITDTNAIVSALRSGDIDIARTISAKDVAGIKSDPNLIYEDMPGIGFYGFELNTAAPPFNDPAKRKAVALAVDKYSIEKNIFFNVGSLGYGPIPPASWAFDPSEKIFDKADGAKAKATATGFSFTYKTATDPVSVQLAQLIQGELAKAGITMNVDNKEFAVYQQECQSHKFEACDVSWSGRIDPDGNMYAWWHTGGDFNDSQYSNADVDRWLDDARVNTDQGKRKSAYDNAQKQIVSDAPYVFERFAVSPKVTSKKVHGFTLYPDLMIRLAEVWRD